MSSVFCKLFSNDLVEGLGKGLLVPMKQSRNRRSRPEKVSRWLYTFFVVNVCSLSSTENINTTNALVNCCLGLSLDIRLY